jgi:hypothetical protein
VCLASVLLSSNTFFFLCASLYMCVCYF